MPMGCSVSFPWATYYFYREGNRIPCNIFKYIFHQLPQGKQSRDFLTVEPNSALFVGIIDADVKAYSAQPRRAPQLPTARSSDSQLVHLLVPYRIQHMRPFSNEASQETARYTFSC